MHAGFLQTTAHIDRHGDSSMGAEHPDHVSDQGPVAAAAVYEFAIERFPDLALLRVSLAVELVKAGQIDEAKRVLKMAFELDPDLRMVALDHPGLNVLW
jgi:tetratricopeptide (TPR) repeat protein